MKKAIFPGSFDPFTIGHYSIVKRGLDVFDEIIIAIGKNQTKAPLFSSEQKKNIIQQAFKGESRVKLKEYNSITVDFAKAENAGFILRGLRTVADFEYEHAAAAANYKLAGIETVLLFTEAQYSFISSSIVRDLIAFEKDISAFLPPNVTI